MSEGKTIIPKSLKGPIVVERHDLDNGEIVYEIWDRGVGSYHCLCAVPEHLNDHARAEAEFVALALNNAIGALRTIANSTRSGAICGE